MPRRSVFYSFHFDNDVMRTQQVRNIGALDLDEPVSATAWETVKSGGFKAVQNWIDANMNRRHCVIVLIGSPNRPPAGRSGLNADRRGSFYREKRIAGCDNAQFDDSNSLLLLSLCASPRHLPLFSACAVRVDPAIVLTQ